MAVIGEGGEPEYVVPQSKAMSFANNIVAGRTGERALKPFDPFGTEITRQAVARASGSRGLNEVDKNILLRSLGWEISPMDGAIFKGRRPGRGPTAAPATRQVSAGGGRALRGRSVATPAQQRSNAPSPPVNVSIQTGPIMEFNGRRYVTMEDFERGMRATADGVIGGLRKPYVRQALGR
jgi:hypothetical protein